MFRLVAEDEESSQIEHHLRPGGGAPSGVAAWCSRLGKCNSISFTYAGGAMSVAKGVSDSLRSPVGRGMLEFFTKSVWEVSERTCNLRQL